jgi:hypothetical protein
VQIFRDYEGREIRLTDERTTHITEGHVEIIEIGLEYLIGETLKAPDRVIPDDRDEEVFKYAWRFEGTMYGDKWVLVVVAIKEDDAFIMTAYITNELQ